MKLLSDEYRKVLIKEHQLTEWGIVGYRYKDFILRKCVSLQVNNLLDYGCGQGLLKKVIEPDVTVTNYDPGLEKYSSLPNKHDLVICFDVLEHVEIDFIDNVLAHLQSLTNKLLILKVDTNLARRILNNGQNAHLIVKNIDWWEEKFKNYFNIKETHDDYLYVLEPK